MPLTTEQQQRYARHIALGGVGAAGQAKLLRAKVLLIGVGGLGSPAALYLAAAGVGTIGLADADAVSLSNLQRQVIHTTADLGRPKALSAGDAMRAINPDVTVNAHRLFVTAANILPLLADYDFVLDCTDTFAAKFLINDACVLAGKPFSHAGILRFGGQLMTYAPGRGAPCYRCVFAAPPPAGQAAEPPAGPIGALPGVIGSLQAMEAIKYITGQGELLLGCLLTYDALKTEFRKIKLPRRTDCAACGGASENFA
ncbi:MAG: HesA/MoeB/ThiF family protein [Oscillospiraceae bacterium]|jgi:molybdopterin/thiamine biosynthesis adenylyltransferase|nr:HesA/MoeB/ThiF family protein [Oscillospiraceae bacterium]